MILVDGYMEIAANNIVSNIIFSKEEIAKKFIGWSWKVGFLKVYFKGGRARRLKSPLSAFCIVNASDVLDG